MRGIRHGSIRPDLIIADDVEDVQSVKTKQGRNKTFEWFTSEIVPAGDTDTKIIVVGNLLHEDSLLMRLKALIQAEEIDGTFVEWRLCETAKAHGLVNIRIYSQFKTMERKVASRIAWEREYMLNLVADEDQIIARTDIAYYDDLPERLSGQYRRVIIGVDLAILKVTKPTLRRYSRWMSVERATNRGCIYCQTS